MTNYEKLTYMSLDEVAQWLDKYGDFDGSTWMGWFDKKYCDSCSGISVTVPAFNNKEMECSFCELEHRCKFFPDKDNVISNTEIIKLWLEAEE